MKSDNDKIREFEKEIVDSSIVNLHSVKAEMNRTFKEGKVKGEVTHFPAIDSKNMFTWKKGSLYCFTGNPGSGKSEFLNMLMILKSKYKGWKWMVYSPESSPVGDFVDTLIHTFIGKSTDPEKENQMSQKEYDYGFKFINEHFKIVDYDYMPTYGEILKVFESNEIDGLVIDPYNSLSEENKPIFDFLKTSLTDIKRSARNNDRCIVLIEHPHSANSLDESGNPREPSQYTLSGGKMWHNKCDVIAVIHRPLVHTEPSDTTVTFRTRKIKNQKLNGIPNDISMRFDVRSNRYFTLHPSGDGRRENGFDDAYKVPELNMNQIPISKDFN